MMRMLIVLFAASVLLSKGGRVQRRQQVAAVTEETASEVGDKVASEVSANTTIFTDRCYADQSSLLHNLGYWISFLSPKNMVFPLYGVATPPIYKVGDCEFAAAAGVSVVLEGVGDITMDYNCAHPGSSQGSDCRNTWCGKKCSWPMDTKFKFNSPIGLSLRVGANLNACGISTKHLNLVNKSILAVGVGASVQITDIDMESQDKFGCGGLVYQGFTGTPQVRGGTVSWNGLHCVIGGLATLGLQMTPTFQDHCTKFLNKLLSDASGTLKDLIAKNVAEQRPTR